LKTLKNGSTVWVAGGICVLLVAVLHSMGDWFRRSEGGKPQPREAATPLEQRLEALERSHRTMRLEWEDVYDRLMKAAARLNARNRRDKPEPQPEADAPNTVDGLPHLGTHDVLAAARGRRSAG